MNWLLDRCYFRLHHEKQQRESKRGAASTDQDGNELKRSVCGSVYLLASGSRRSSADGRSRPDDNRYPNVAPARRRKVEPTASQEWRKNKILPEE